VAALKTLNERIGTEAWQAELAMAGGLDGAVYYGHLLGMLNARDGTALLAAHDALQQDLQALAR
jgi:hypothetical protein